MITAKKIVIKVGTSTLTYTSGLINIRKIESLAKCISDLQNSGKNFVLVSSGAVSAGMAKLGLTRHKLTTQEKQAASSVGQCELLNMYDRIFASYGHQIAQILLTKDVIDDDVRCSNAKGTFRSLINMGCIPIVNENDAVSSEQINFGSNDTLSAVVAQLCDADLLINMTDIDGLYTADPKKDENAKLITYVEKIDDELMKIAGGAGTERGTGGMHAKLEAARIVTEAGIPMIIVNGKNPEILYDVVGNEYTGTYFDVAKKE